VVRKATNIPAEDLRIALQALASQRGFQLVYRADLVTGVRTSGAHGDLTTGEALAQLLRGTSLTYRYLGGKAVTIVRAGVAAAPDVKGGSAVRRSDKDYDEKAGGSFSNGFPVAQTDQGSSAQGSSVEKEGDQPIRLEEVVVTAEKREERLQDVPIPVTAINTQALTESGQVLLRDYYSSIPGLNVSPGVQSSQDLSIRGITTGGFTNPTVGITVDDVPIAGSTAVGGGLVIPDMDPSDLARIEVLRGPQGTLYGASSMGGLVKFVTLDPTTDQISGRVQAGASDVYNGAEPGYNVRAAVNLPVSDTTAIRMSGYTREDPGYIDNPVLNLDGVNEAHSYGGLFSLLWKQSDDFSLKFTGLYQKTRSNGLSDVMIQPGLAWLQQNYIRGAGGYDRSTQVYSLTLKARLGVAELTSVTGYSINQYADSWDFTYGFGPLNLSEFGVSGAPIFEFNTTDKFTQEVRLSVPLGSQTDWMVGAFYTHEGNSFVQDIDAEDTGTGAVVGQFASFIDPATYEEYAGFTDLTYHFTDRFDLQIGGRESQIRQTYAQTTTGVYDTLFLDEPSPVVVPTAHASANAFTYLVTPRFKLSPDLMLYARLASGYRAGGPNAAPGTPPQYSPDKTENYELGMKGDFLGHILSVDTSLYYIEWKDIQLSLQDPQNFQDYVANGSAAKSQGIELSLDARPLPGMTISTWGAWNDAELTQPFPLNTTAYGVAGDRLPLSSRFSSHFAINQEFPLAGEWSGFAGASVSYVGDRLGVFAATSQIQRQDYPGYTKTDLRMGVRRDAWTATIYANNVANTHGVVGGGQGYFPPYAFQYIQPRMVGLNVVRQF
jgi:outer membrane receptor protein involved in Fe transport